MVRYFIKRVLTLIPVLLAVSFLVFWLMSMTGDPARTIAGDTVTEAQLEQMRETMGLNEPITVRFGRWLSNALLHGDFGKSLYGDDCWKEFALRFPHTLKLAITSILLTIAIAVPFGIVAAVKQNSWVDTLLSSTAILGLSMPTFWMGMLLIVLFSVKLNWLPSGGDNGTILSLLMPMFCSAVNNVALVTRMTRSSMVDQIRADYLRTARAKGVSEKKVLWGHALKNALIPIITTIGTQLSFLIGGTTVIETVFSWPGVGSYTVACIRSNDFMPATCNVVLISTMTAVILIVVDMLYAFVDPRIKARYKRG
ncbi:MAG: ABC transporter permease [Clostridia bacterium]|nr:ABC transporter permease [Clostridia bacterium]